MQGRAERNHILMEMTEEVAELVLADNATRPGPSPWTGSAAPPATRSSSAFIEDLIAAGVLSRSDDAIPTREELLASPHEGRGLPRPLLAVLLGHTKMWAFEMVMQTSFPESAAGRPFLARVLPAAPAREFADHFEEHALRREIVATAAVNHLVNCAGVTFLSRMMAEPSRASATSSPPTSRWTRPRTRARCASGCRRRGMPAEAEHRALLEVEDALEGAARRVLAGAKEDPAVELGPVLANIGA